FSRIRSSLKMRSLLRLQSAMNAAPTSLFKGTEMPRRVTVSLLGGGLGVNERSGGAGLLGVGASSLSTLKPGTIRSWLIIAFDWRCIEDLLTRLSILRSSLDRRFLFCSDFVVFCVGSRNFLCFRFGG